MNERKFERPLLHQNEVQKFLDNAKQITYEKYEGDWIEKLQKQNPSFRRQRFTSCCGDTLDKGCKNEAVFLAKYNHTGHQDEEETFCEKHAKTKLDYYFELGFELEVFRFIHAKGCCSITRPMKAIILAAGMGKRLFPLSNDVPKCLVELEGKTLLEHEIEKLHNCGITDITVVIGWKAEDIKKKIGDQVEYVFNPFYRTTNNIVSLWLARHKMTEDTLILDSDILFEPEILVSIVTDKGTDISMLMDSTRGAKSSDFKLLAPNGLVKDMSKTLLEWSGEYAGIVKIPKERLQDFNKDFNILIAEEKLSIWYELVLQQMITNRQYPVRVIDIGGKYWVEIDSMKDLEAIKNAKKE